MTLPLLREHAAGDARPAADAGLRLAGDALVLVAVNDDGGAVGVEERQRPGRRGSRAWSRPSACPCRPRRPRDSECRPCETGDSRRDRCCRPGPDRSGRRRRRSRARTCRPRAGARRAARLEPARRDGDRRRRRRCPGLALDELGRAGDAVALDVCRRARSIACAHRDGAAQVHSAGHGGATVSIRPCFIVPPGRDCRSAEPCQSSFCSISTARWC